MKKKLAAFVLSSSMVLSLAVPAFAAATNSDPTKEPGKYLQEIGVIKGDQNGDLLEGSNWKRQDVTVLLSTLLKQKEEAKATANTHGFTDVRGTNYNGFISWAKEKGYMVGESATKFGFDSEISYHDFAAIVLRALDYKVAYADVPTAAVEAKILPQGTDFTAKATRGNSYAVIVAALNTVIPGTGQTLGNKLGLPGFEVTALAIANVAQTNKGEITVNFNKEVTAEQKTGLTYEVKIGLVNYPVTAKFADDNKSVVLTSSYLPVGTYSVTVKGFDAKEVTIVNEVATKIEITANSLQKAEGQDLGVKVLNQFNKEIANANPTVSVFNATKGASIAAANGKYNLKSDDVAKVDDNIVVTASHTGSGLSATKTYKVVAGSAATAIKLGTVAPLKDKNRITAGDSGLILPVELTDQYGGKIKLAETAKKELKSTDMSFEISGITFVVSQLDVITHYAVDKDGVLTFDVKKAATLVINALNPATGATASTSVKVEGAPVIKTLNLQTPAAIIAAGEEVKFEFTAFDNFDQPVAAKDVKLGLGTNEVDLTKSSIAFAPGYPKINAKGELLFKFANTTDTKGYIYGYVNNVQVANVSFDVRKPATAVKITGIKDVLTTLANGASVDFNKDKVTYEDDYGRTHTVAGLKKADDSNAVGTVEIERLSGGDSVGIVTETGNLNVKSLLADATKTGETRFKISIKGVANSSYEFTVSSKKLADVKSYEIKSVGTIYGGKTGDDKQNKDSAYAAKIELVGKLENGTQVALVQDNAFNFLTSANGNVGVDSDTKKIFGLAEGTAVVTAYNGATKLAEITVTVSTAAPVATKVEFNKSEYTVKKNDKLQFKKNADGDNKVTITDQYGVKNDITGLLASSNSDVAKVNVLEVTGVAAGQTTLTYVTSNNLTATAVIVVEN